MPRIDAATLFDRIERVCDTCGPGGMVLGRRDAMHVEEATFWGK